MPHVIVKLWPGKSEKQKKQLAADITRAVMKNLDYGEESVSVAMEEVPARDWRKHVFQANIKDKWDTLYQKPGYSEDDLP